MMKKITLIILFITPLLGLSQVISNGEFDTDISGWVGQNNPTELSWDATEGFSAAGSMKIVAADANNSGAKTEVNTSPGDLGDYIVKLRIKGTAGTSIRIDVFQADPGAGFIGGTQYTIQANDIWEEATSSFNFSSSEPINVRIIGRTNNATYYIDDVEFLALTSAENPVANPDFEIGSTTPDSWTISGGPNASLGISNNAQSGSQAAEITITETQSENIGLENINVDLGRVVNTNNIEENRISASFYALSNNTTAKFQIRIQLFDDADQQVYSGFSGQSNELSASNTYEEITLNKVVDPDVNFSKVKITIRIHSSSSLVTDDVVLLDNVQVGFSELTLSNNDYDLKNGLVVYPNPARERLFIKSSDVLKAVDIFDITGKNVITTTNFNESVDISTLNRGLYIVKITSANNSIMVKKLIKD